MRSFTLLWLGLALGPPSPLAVAITLLNENSKPAGTEINSLRQLTPGALVDGDGGFFCNAFVGTVKNEKRILTASHCVPPEGGLRFLWLDASGKTQQAALSKKPDFLGDLELEEEAKAPVDLAVLRADLPQALPAPSLEIERFEVPKTGEQVAVVFFHKTQADKDTLKLNNITCSIQASVPKVRASLKAGTEVVHALDLQMGLSRKGIAYDERIGLFLDRCQTPLPEGASGALVVRLNKKGDGAPLAILHTGVTTAQLGLGWHQGGWSETFWNAADGDGGPRARLEAQLEAQELSLNFHYLASDSKAYGPLTKGRAVDGKGTALFLFGAAFRLSELKNYLP